jgi:hypothetical protein
MHAKCLMVLAAVGVAAFARVALLAVDVGFHRATVAGLNILHVLTNRHDFNTKLVARDSRITEERHLAQVAAVVRSANSYTVDANHRHSWTRNRWFGNIDIAECLWALELHCLH